MRPYAATQIGAKTISYDANGNMVSDGTRTLTSDRSNRLSTVTQNGATVTLAYGPDRARVKKSWADRFHAFRLYKRKRNRFVVLFDGLLERLDLLADD